MRAFVAVIPPAPALTELSDAVAPVRAAHPDLRWTPPEQWHLTLAFLGDVDEAVLPELTERLARAARRHPPLELAFAGGGRFGDRVLWTRVVDPPQRESPVSTGRVAHLDRAAGRPRGPAAGRAAGLRRLTASVGAAARRCGIPVEDRPYRAHLTLARARTGADLRTVAALLGEFTGSRWTADALHLVSSRLGAGPGGTAAHDVVRSWPLGGGAAT
jgi:RNA 2',3'-cyclic 3'-phosphodiesterase